MKHLFFVSLFCVFVLHCGAQDYDPCGLAKELYMEKDVGLLHLRLEDIPLLVCLAGYHHYNLTFLSHRIDKQNYELRYYGIFGQPHPEVRNTGLKEQVISLQDDVLDKKNLRYRFIRYICSGNFVYRRPCDVRLDVNVWSKYLVPLPWAPDMMYGFHPIDPFDGFDPFSPEENPIGLI
ncbi:hypothetical protein GE061_005092 [Apolygus lucorum]|uniref:Uncharacterized protein n=1 Tax=Apolygus lucorum TaxID=248454 RepID=A0A8S9WWQ9_APOLU|nr:hypothetical protein GE061_005092 [Apolygus lucorum]